MPLPTRIVGPYDEFDTTDKLRIHFGVPKDIVKDMFTDILPFRGAQDKVCARLFHIFWAELKSIHPDIATYNDQRREEVVNELLNLIASRSHE